MIELLERLTGVFGPSGNEEMVREIIKDEIQNHVDEIKTDVMGNLIGIKRGTGKKIMLAAHMDEVGVMASFIDEKGFIRFSGLGGVSPFYMIHRRVRFKSGTLGVISFEEQLEDMKDLKLNKMYIDIGAESRADAENRVNIGEAGVLSGEFMASGNMLISKAMDDRSGCAVLVQVAKELPETENEIYFTFTVQEELGLRGAKTVSYKYDLDLALAVDVTLSGDTPKAKPMEVKLGKGPAFKVMDAYTVCHPEVKRLLVETAEGKNIPYQMEVLFAGGSDIGALHLSKGGVPSGAVSIPCRYVHSGSEVVNRRDLEYAVRLLVGAVSC